MMNWLLKCLEIATKNIEPFSRKILCPKPKHQNRCHQHFHSALPIFPKTEPMPNPRFLVPPTSTLVPPKISEHISSVSVSRIKISEFWNRSHRDLDTAQGHRIGTIKIYLSVSPRIQKLPHLVQLGTTEIHVGVTEFGNNVVTVGFWEMPI